MSEFINVAVNCPSFSFNDTPKNRTKDKVLVQIETFNIMPQNYDIKQIRLYGGIATWNEKVYNQLNQMGANVVKLNGFPLFDNYYQLDEFIPTEEKDGVCIMCRYRGKPQFDYDLSYKRVETFMNLKGMTKHAYGTVPYADEHYRGVAGTGQGTYPSSLDKFKVLNKYKFAVCFENAYHPLWSWDYITEKILDCFKAKVIPIYYGCYNIEKIIPPELYIDYRQFKNDDELSEYLNEFDMSKYDEMVDKAYEWEKTFQWGKIPDMLKTLKEFYETKVVTNK